MFVPAVDPPQLSDGLVHRWILVNGSDVAVEEEGDTDRFPEVGDPAELGITTAARHYLGRLDDCHCWSATIDDRMSLPKTLTWRGLRSLYGRIDVEQWVLAGRAVQIEEWERNHQFCGRCGKPTTAVPAERAKKCPSCGFVVYPRISPAVIVLVERDGKALMAQGRNAIGAPYGIIAGFVEPGETLEEAVRREVREEVGLTLGEIRYFGSQPWPFPDGLMIGFTADWASGEITIDPKELADARWFAVDNLPRLPSELSIARQLVDDWLERQKRT